MKDSTTHVSPADPKARSDIISLTAAIVSDFVVGRRTPLPAASPEAFTTCLSFSSRDLTYARASSTFVKLRYFAVGISLCCKKSFVNALLASSSAAALEQPKTRTSGQAIASSSTIPSTNGCSGPTTTISALTRFVSAITVALSCFPFTSTAFEIFPPSTAVPPFPGQQITLETRGDLAKATANACSLPPDPTTINVSDILLGPQI
mmetsp:Transcript_16339/g.15784  ORF Transcript_16339/g.15784 Transcript_16339/m.15784 type:complete len:206 (-) Transcript_16339:91-708(-)